VLLYTLLLPDSDKITVLMMMTIMIITRQEIAIKH